MINRCSSYPSRARTRRKRERSSSMAAIIKLLFVVFFLGLAVNSNGQCSIANLKLKQQKTGFQIHGQTQWKANFTNDCACTLLDIKLDCTGFETTESVDPNILAVSGSVCALNSGSGGLGPFYSVEFTYASDAQFAFKPVEAQIACS